MVPKTGARMRKYILGLLALLVLMLLWGGYYGAKMFATSLAEKKLDSVLTRMADTVAVTYRDVDVELLGLNLLLTDMSFALAKGQSFTVDAITVEDIDIAHSKPHYLVASLKGVALDITEENLGSQAETLRELGYAKLKADLKVDFAYDEEAHRLVINSLDVRCPEVGNFRLTLALSAFSPERLKQGAFEDLIVDTLRFDYDDLSFLKRLTELASEGDQQFMDFVVKGLQEDIETARRESDMDQIQSLSALVSFLKRPGRISIRSHLNKRVTIRYILQEKKISKLLQLISIRFSSG